MQDYLIEEGYRMLDEFGNHPSFVMMSLGNELWGSKETLNFILKGYRDMIINIFMCKSVTISNGLHVF